MVSLEKQARELSGYFNYWNSQGKDITPYAFLGLLSRYNESASVICLEKNDGGAQLLLDSFSAGEVSLPVYASIADHLQKHKSSEPLKYDRVGVDFVPLKILSEFDSGEILDSGVIYHGGRSSDYARMESGILVRPQQIRGNQQPIPNLYGLFKIG